MPKRRRRSSSGRKTAKVQREPFEIPRTRSRRTVARNQQIPTTVRRQNSPVRKVRVRADQHRNDNFERNAFNRNRIIRISTVPNICFERIERRKSLFANKIAGTGKKLSPGKGGKYRRDENSRIKC